MRTGLQEALFLSCLCEARKHNQRVCDFLHCPAQLCSLTVWPWISPFPSLGPVGPLTTVRGWPRGMVGSLRFFFLLVWIVLFGECDLTSGLYDLLIFSSG